MIKGHFDVEEFRVPRLAELAEPLPSLKPINMPKPIRFLRTLKKPEEILTYTEQKRFNFWRTLIEKIKEVNVKIPDLGKDLVFSYVIADGWGGIEFILSNIDRDINKKRFKILEAYKKDIHNRLDTFSWYISDELEWDFKEQRNNQRLLIRFKDYGINERNYWDKIQYKMIDGMKALVKTIQNFIEKVYPNF